MFVLSFIILFVQENFQITDYLNSSFDNWYKYVFSVFFGFLIGKYLDKIADRETS
jgi:hypothetical protein